MENIQKEAITYAIMSMENSLKHTSMAIGEYQRNYNDKYPDYKKMVDKELPKLLAHEKKLLGYVKALKELL